MSVWLPLNNLFSRRELWYHLLMMPVLFPAGNYLFLRERYFTDPAVFGGGTLLVFCLYWLSLVILTASVKAVFRRFPAARQVRQRNLLALLVATTLTAGLATVDVWAYSLFPVFRRPFNWQTVRAILLLGFGFDILLCFVLGIQYTYSRWQESQTEKERLKRLVLQQQVDRLKQQLNPTFLFNALRSISVLIASEPKQAELFVDEMALVYRYMLQANQLRVVTLADEVAFLRSYSRLLTIQFNATLAVTIHIGAACETLQLPPLSLQLLLDTIIQQCPPALDNPLWITVDTTPGNWLRITHNRHQSPPPAPSLPEIRMLINGYRALNSVVPMLETNASGSGFLLPLLADSWIATPAGP